MSFERSESRVALRRSDGAGAAGLKEKWGGDSKRWENRGKEPTIAHVQNAGMMHNFLTRSSLGAYRLTYGKNGQHPLN